MKLICILLLVLVAVVTISAQGELCMKKMELDSEVREALKNCLPDKVELEKKVDPASDKKEMYCAMAALGWTDETGIVNSDTTLVAKIAVFFEDSLEEIADCLSEKVNEKCSSLKGTTTPETA